jgi:hypothetical protein
MPGYHKGAGKSYVFYAMTRNKTTLAFGRLDEKPFFTVW